MLFRSLAQSDAAAMRQAAVLRRIEAEIASLYQRASAAADAWQQTSLAARGLERNAALTARAYEAGEASFPDVLAARRLAQEAAINRSAAALEALELRYRLMLDAHQLWPLDDDAGEHAH